jgi:hypothetical protein
MRVGVVIDDLMFFSRIDAAAVNAGATAIRVSSPSELPNELDLVLVDWSAGRPEWGAELRRFGARVILFGPHTDLEAHAAARPTGLGPMRARSSLLSSLASEIAGARREPSDEPSVGPQPG